MKSDKLKRIYKMIFKSYHLRDYKFLLIISILILSTIGILAVGSARPDLRNRQIMGVAMGLVIMVVVSLIDYKWILSFYWITYAFTILSLVSVLIFGVERGGATRWIDIGFVQFQPSELSKVLLILFFSQFVMKHKDNLNSKWTLFKYAVLCGIPLFLVVVEPSLSSTITIALILITVILAGGLSFKLIGGVLLVLAPLAIIFLSIVVQPDQKLLKDYQRGRIMAFIQPEKYESTLAHQQNNSVMAIGSGQLQGKGLNNNTTTSVKNGNFISEPQTDFIFAIIGEELGFIGCSLVIALILFIVIQCMLIGIKASNFAGYLVCCGVGGWIGIQSFINIGVATKLLPNTGVPLPFVSYGLTSLVCLFLAIGVVLNIGLQQKKYK